MLLSPKGFLESELAIESPIAEECNPLLGFPLANLVCSPFYQFS